MKIKLIAEGSSKWDRFIMRWGVSFLIDDDILFDVFGDPGIFLNNAQKMNIDFSKIRHIVLSHDDWDHIAGLQYIINTYKDLAVYICPNFNQEIKDRISSFGVNIVEVSGLLRIKGKVYSTGQMEGRSEGRVIFEQTLVIKFMHGAAIITGCAHPGIINIIDNVKKQFNENTYLILGGLHLKYKTTEEIREVISKLESYGVKKIAPLHCTGKRAKRLLKDVYKDNYVYLKIGQVLEL